MLTARFQPPFIFYHTICHTQRYAHQEEYFALDDAEFRNVTSILKLLALGAHKVCRTLHVSSFAYDAPFFSPCFFLLSLLWHHVGRGWGSLRLAVPTHPPNLFQGTCTRPAKSDITRTPTTVDMDMDEQTDAVISLRVPFPLSCSTLSRGGFARPSFRPSIYPFALSSLNPFASALFVVLFVCFLNAVRHLPPFFLLSFRVFLLYLTR